MGRTRRNCPVFGCGSRNLARIANHLDQVHGMDTNERMKWLKFSKIGITLPLEKKETRMDNVEINTENVVEQLLNQVKKKQANLDNFHGMSEYETTREECLTEKGSRSNKWLTLYK